MPETLKKMRLDKFLTQAAELTRSEAKQKIKKGSVTVNGEVVKKAEMKVSSEDAICLDGEVVTYEKYRYIMLHKPAGVVSATDDAQIRRGYYFLQTMERWPIICSHRESM